MKPIVITATLAAWVHSGYAQRNLISHLECGEWVKAAGSLVFYGTPDKDKFGEGYVRVGEADVTVRLLPKDEQTRLAVQALQAQLDEERIKWHERQQAILAEISKLSAISFDGEVIEA